MSPRRLVVALAVLATAAAPLSAQTTVVDFEDLTGQAALPATYGGINWLGSGWMHYDYAQHPFTANSGDVRVYRHSSVNQFGFAGGAAVFEGAWFAGTTNAHFRLYLDGTLVHTTDALSLSATPAFLSSGFAGTVDLVELHVRSGTQWVMDDVQYSAAHATVTPEPGTVLLMATGLVAVGGIARRRRRAS